MKTFDLSEEELKLARSAFFSNYRNSSAIPQWDIQASWENADSFRQTWAQCLNARRQNAWAAQAKAIAVHLIETGTVGIEGNSQRALAEGMHAIESKVWDVLKGWRR